MYILEYIMYQIKVSTKKNKKYDVFKNGKYHLSFGAIKKDGSPYEQYKDSTGIGAYSAYDHGDKERRRRYYLRHPKTKDKNSARYWSNRYLW